MVASPRAVPHLWVVSDRAPVEGGEAVLAAAVARGEVWAIEGAWNRYSGLAVGLLARGLGPGADAEALAQEIFLSLAAALRRARDPDALRKCVVALSARRLLKELRRRQLRRWLGVLRRSSPVDFVDSPLEKPAYLSLVRLYELADELGPTGRALLVLAEFEGISETDIAEAFGWSLGRVVSQLARARAEFERRLDEDPTLSQYLAAQRQNQSEISEGA